ncbi:uncharacterized protein LOC135499174 [Lineus longissimus]|uniref:uncharacterized protein LOC135499174 n=1 Tax=Lineus longissimus TaxID=88925 RepID=UPI002B4CA3A4
MSTFDLISSWKIPELKLFLNKRGLKTSGSKQELVARVFAANELDLPIIKNAVERLQENEADYRNLLCSDGREIPDPLKLNDGWLSESQALRLWPPVFYSDICNYLMQNHLGEKDLTKRILNEYKEGKAWRYFKKQWVKEVFFHQISADSPVCFLKNCCTPSERLSEPPYNVWVLIKKSCGEVISGYCTCPAGYVFFLPS